MFTLEDWMTFQLWYWVIGAVLLIVFRKQFQAFYRRLISKGDAEFRPIREFVYNIIVMLICGWPMLLFFILTVL